MAIINKGGAKKIKEEVQKENTFGKQLEKELLEQFNQLHSKDVWDDKELEQLLLKDNEARVAKIGQRPDYPRDLVKFNPSGASKTVTDLYLKAKGYKEQVERYPYHRRWTRNSTAVHEAVQRDLLYTEKYANGTFRVGRMKNGLPAWEHNVLRWRKISYKGKDMILNGMLDGILIHEPTGKKVGFELKTKSNTLGQVGHYKMKKPFDYHVDQCVAYFLLTGIRDYLLTYEGLAKPQWLAMAEAKPDLRVFHVEITDEMAEKVLDKWAYVVDQVEKDELPEDPELGFFSGYKYLFDEEGNFIG